MDVKSLLQKKLKNLQLNVDLYKYNTMKVHSIARFFLNASSINSIISSYLVAREAELKFLLLGGGSNAVMKSHIRDTLVVKNSYVEKHKLRDNGKSVDFFISSGYLVSKLVKENITSGLGGTEYHLGLPGTVGGAIYMNSKWTKPLVFFGDNLLNARILTKKGLVKKVQKDYFQFGYDFSILQKTKEIFLDGVFRFKKEKSETLLSRAHMSLEYRKKTQPFGIHTSGCFFQNIPKNIKVELNLPTTSAGYLIDSCGLKGYEVGDFAVSKKHANFIINKGSGNPRDLIKLIRIIKDEVKKKFGVKLKEEVIVI